MFIAHVNQKNPYAYLNDNSRMKKKRWAVIGKASLEKSISFINFENPNNQNLPLAPKSISLDLPQTEIS